MIEINNTTKFRINKKELVRIGESFLRRYGFKNKDISLAFVSESVIKRLNNTYRQKNKITDVLSFEGDDNFLGEIVISPVQIKRQAQEAKHSFLAELNFIFVHGLLHLAGYNDETEKNRLEMIKVGEEFLKKYKK